MRIRTLRLEEYERLLDLLDLWPLDDGWQGRDFFRRYMEDDPSFSVRNVWVAIDGENRLRSCVQIFPRSILLRGQEVRCGGIGSVFTHPDARRQGLAEDLLKAAVVAMTQRGFEVSLLFAARIAWYTKLGWRSLERPAWYLSSPRAGRVDRRQVAIRPLAHELGCGDRGDAQSRPTDERRGDTVALGLHDLPIRQLIGRQYRV